MGSVNQGGEGDIHSSLLSFSGAKGILNSLASASQHFVQQFQGSPLPGIINKKETVEKEYRTLYLMVM